MSFFRTCLDGHMCENGSSCMEHPLEEGTYYCDCSTGNGDFAGLFCEYSADTYCQLPQETSSTWFCTNGGTCVLATSGGNGQPAAWTCDCTVGDYEGPVSAPQESGWGRGSGDREPELLLLSSVEMAHSLVPGSFHSSDVLVLFFCRSMYPTIESPALSIHQGQRPQGLAGI